MNRFQCIPFFICLSVISIFVLSGQAAAATYEINWLNVTKRIYADERGKKNILQFAVTYEGGSYIPGTDGSFVNFDSVELYDPSDEKVDLSAITFYPGYEYKSGSFDSTAGGWNFNDTVIIYEFQADILEPVIPGVYELRLKCDDQQTYTATKTFNQIVSVPFISNKSYQIHPDSEGNVYFSWDVPKSILQLAESYDIIYRPGVVAYEGETIKALLYPSSNVQVNMLFVPSSVIQWLAGKGSTFSFGVNVRTADGQNRSHQIPLSVNDMLTTVIKKKEVAVIPMF